VAPPPQKKKSLLTFPSLTQLAFGPKENNESSIPVPFKQNFLTAFAGKMFLLDCANYFLCGLSPPKDSLIQVQRFTKKKKSFGKTHLKTPPKLSTGKLGGLKLKLLLDQTVLVQMGSTTKQFTVTLGFPTINPPTSRAFRLVVEVGAAFQRLFKALGQKYQSRLEDFQETLLPPAFVSVAAVDA